MGNIKDFMDELSGEIMSILPQELTKDLSINPTTVTKMNDQVLYGLTFKRAKMNSAPTIYVNEEFENHQEGKPLEVISDQMAHIYLDSMFVRPEIIPQDLRFENVKDDLTIRVLEIKRNKMYLSEIPYMPLGNGFAAVCDVKVNQSEEGFWRTTVTKSFMEEHDYDINDIFMSALEHAPVVDPPVLTTFEDKLFGLEETNYLESGKISEEDKVPMFVLTNECGLFGAAVLFYPGVQEKIAENLGEGYYAIPSSVHEFLIVPESFAPDPIDLSGLVKTANSTMVEPKDVLSDNVLHYDCERGQLDIAVHTIDLSEKQVGMRC